MRIPSHLAALMQTNISAQGLTVEAILSEDPARIYHAAMLAPTPRPSLTSTRSGLVDDLLAAHVEWIPEKLRSHSKQGSAAAA
jgi:alpha-galactosidase